MSGDDLVFPGPKPEVVVIPIRPVTRVDADDKRVVVPTEELAADQVYRIRVGMLPIASAEDIEGILVGKVGLVAALMSKAKAGTLDAAAMASVLTTDEIRKLAELLGPVCDAYNGTSPQTGAERWIPMTPENRGRMFGGGRMLAYNRWIWEALRVNFADFFDGLGLGNGFSVAGLSSLLARVK